MVCQFFSHVFSLFRWSFLNIQLILVLGVENRKREKRQKTNQSKSFLISCKAFGSIFWMHFYIRHLFLCIIFIFFSHLLYVPWMYQRTSFNKSQYQLYEFLTCNMETYDPIVLKMQNFCCFNTINIQS